MSMTISKLPNDPSKEQEITFLNKVAESIPLNSYLTDLFTPKFLNWVTQAIKDDFPPDLFDWYEKQSGELSDQRMETQAGYRLQEDLNKRLTEATDRIAKKDKQLDDALVQINQTLGIANERYEEWKEKDAEVTTLQNEIVLLKAKLYDLMVKP